MSLNDYYTNCMLNTTPITIISPVKIFVKYKRHMPVMPALGTSLQWLPQAPSCLQNLQCSLKQTPATHGSQAIFSNLSPL